MLKGSLIIFKLDKDIIKELCIRIEEDQMKPSQYIKYLIMKDIYNNRD